MALPTNLAARVKNLPMDPSVMATELETAYLLSYQHHRTPSPTQPPPMTPSTAIPATPSSLPSNSTSTRTSTSRPKSSYFKSTN